MVVQQVPKPMEVERVGLSVRGNMNGSAAGAKTDEWRKNSSVCE